MSRSPPTARARRSVLGPWIELTEGAKWLKVINVNGVLMAVVAGLKGLPEVSGTSSY
jgi:hypothetical protein